MRINDLHDCLPKTLLLKTFGERISVMEFVASRSGKPRCGFLLYEFDLTQSPVVPVAAYIERSVTFEPRHFVLSMKAIPLTVTRHIVRCMDAAISAVGKFKFDSSLPVFENRVRALHPFKGISGTRPHVMIAANENKRIHLID
jgi:hypothetical protein